MRCQDPGAGGALPRPASAQEQGHPDARLDGGEKAAAGATGPQGGLSCCLLPQGITRCHHSLAGHISCQPPGSQTAAPPACSFLEGGTSRWISQAVGAGPGPSLVPAAEGLTSRQAEDDRGVEGVTGPQSIHHAGRREGIRVEQLSVRAQRVGALLCPGTDQRGPARPSVSVPLPGADPESRLTHFPHPPSLAPPAHPFLTRLYKPLRASTADWNPKCLATSLLTNTCAQWERLTISLTLVRARALPPAA